MHSRIVIMSTFWANRDAPSRCIATECLVISAFCILLSSISVFKSNSINYRVDWVTSFFLRYSANACIKCETLFSAERAILFMTDGQPTDGDSDNIMNTIYSRNGLLNNTVTILTYLIGGKFEACCFCGRIPVTFISDPPPTHTHIHTPLCCSRRQWNTFKM